MLESPGRVLLIRTSALGDIVHCLPTLTALRRRLPEAHIGWVVEDVFAPLLGEHPDLDEILPVRTKLWRRAPVASKTRAEFGLFRERLREFEADVVLDLMGNHKAGLIARLSGCPKRIGAAAAVRREPSSAAWINIPVSARPPHAVDRAISLLEPLGAGPSDAVFEGDRILPNVHPVPSPPILLQPGAGWTNKEYPPEQWSSVLDLLFDETGLRSGILVGPGERPLAEQIGATTDAPTELIDAPSLPELVAHLRGTDVVLGGDTGPIHLAHALGTAVVCVMGPTDPARNGPYGSPEAAVWHELPCSFCGRRFDEPKACMYAIDPPNVVRAVKKTLASFVT